MRPRYLWRGLFGYRPFKMIVALFRQMHTQSMVEHQVIFVLAMGRSGTSMLARILSICGARLPEALIAPTFGNPTGYWEPATALKLNEEVLHRHNSSWYDPSLEVQSRGLNADESEAFIEQICAFFHPVACPVYW